MGLIHNEDKIEQANQWLDWELTKSLKDCTFEETGHRTRIGRESPFEEVRHRTGRGPD